MNTTNNKTENKEKDWKFLEEKYGKSISQIIETPLQVHKKLIGVQKVLVKPREPALLLQKKDMNTEWREGVTQGVFTYLGSDGEEKKIWLSKKYLSTMEWGHDSFRYYNCTEDSFLPNGFNNTELEYEELKKIMLKQALNHEKLKARELEAQGEMIWDIAKGIALILGVIVLGIVVANLFGIDILGYFQQTPTETITKTIQTNTTVIP